MKKVNLVKGKVFPLGISNMNTDQIIPAKWMKRLESTNYGDGLFEYLRTNSEFILNDPARQGAKFLLGGKNFGCGSSREHAAWALRDFGIEVVVASSFDEIHRRNLVNCGLVPALVDDDAFAVMLSVAKTDPTLQFLLNLKELSIKAAGCFDYPFAVSAGDQQRLLMGEDMIDITLQNQAAINEFEKHRPSWMPKVF
jgi:3-isopropylmalate/(R)-2-methylmalate dehydratase small subunit